MIRSIDLNVKPSQISIQLAKPNRNIVGKIKAFNKTPVLKLSLGRMNEITFTIPYKVEKNHELVDNQIVSLIRNRFLLKVNWNHISEWFIINDLSDSVDDNSEGMVVHAFSLGNELKDKLIEQLKEESLTPQQILTEALSSSNWDVGTIDTLVMNKYRSFDVTETTVLDFLFTIADTYGVLLVFDSENKKVNLVHPDNYKINRGFKIAYGQYLKALTRDSNSDDMTTQLIAEGKDGLSINRINPTGANYIESFDYFMYPFERDVNKNVLQHSDFMSDELCHAILDYEALVESKNGQFASLLDQLNSLQTTLTSKQNELDTLNTQWKTIDDQITICKASNEDYSTLLTQENDKQTEINSKQAEIDSVNSQIDAVNVSINNLKAELSIENNFTSNLIIERNDYIITKKWSDDNYIDDQELYNDAKVKFDDVRKPKINITVSSVNFFQMIEEQRNWNKLFLGDVITVRHPMINTSYEVFITDMEVSDEGLNLTIADFQEIRKGDALLQKINQSYSSSLTVDMSKYKWDQTTSDLNQVNQVINNTWDATKRRITAGVHESVEISERGIIIKSPDYPNDLIILQAGVMAISGDSGATWKTVSNKDGVVAQRLFGTLLAGENLIIDSTDTNGKKTFTVDGNGVIISGQALTITDGGSPDTYNGVTIDSTDGLVVTKQSTINGATTKVARVKLNATDGIRVQKTSDNGTTWIDNLYIDNSGNVTISGTLNGATGTFTGTLSGGSINISTDATIGHNLYLGSLTDYSLKTIYFNDNASISGDNGLRVEGGAITINAATDLELRNDGGSVVIGGSAGVEISGGITPAHTWYGSVPSGGAAYIYHYLGYNPIVNFSGNLGNLILTSTNIDANTVKVENYNTGGNSWSGTVYLW